MPTRMDYFLPIFGRTCARVIIDLAFNIVSDYVTALSTFFHYKHNRKHSISATLLVNL